MIEAYLEKSPAAMKVPVMLEECELPYRTTHVPVTTGAQHRPAFRAISPNDKVPAIVDPEPAFGGGPLALFESGAILLYLAEKTGRFLAIDPRTRAETLVWLFWQAAGLSPMSGQLAHFSFYAPADAKPYAVARYGNEVDRLYGVLNQRLAGRPFICGEYGIADMAAYPWVRLADRLGQRLKNFAELHRWFEAISRRPAVQRAYERAERDMPSGQTTVEDMRRHMFGHTARSLGLLPGGADGTDGARAP